MLWLSYLLMFFLLLVGFLLIFIILLQRGRGGGLAGALGGMGGQSAFGTKAGDLFTRVTVILAIIWIVLCAGQIPLLRALSTDKYEAPDIPAINIAPPKKDAAREESSLPADDTPAADQPAANGESPVTPPGAESKPEEPAPKSDDATPKTDGADQPKTEEQKPATSEASPAEPEKKSE